MTTGALPGLTANIKFIAGRADGYRRVDALGSQILVDAGPVADFSRIAATGIYRNRTVVYALGGSTKFYLGRGEGHKRVPMQVNALASSIAQQFYLIYPRDPRIDRRVARYLEGRLIPAAFACGAQLINRLVAYPPDDCDDGQLDYERLFSEATLFLTAAGCPILNPKTQSETASADGFVDGFQIIAADEFTPPEDAVMLRLKHPKIHCEGYAVGGDHLIIKPGSHFVIKEGRGDLRESNFRRHQSIKSAGILEYSADDPCRARTKAWLKFEKRGVASRVLARAHATPLVWEPVEPEGAPVSDHGGDHDRAL
jgi:hypothetical protein